MQTGAIHPNRTATHLEELHQIAPNCTKLHQIAPKKKSIMKTRLATVEAKRRRPLPGSKVQISCGSAAQKLT
jgi:hypothetical protein